LISLSAVLTVVHLVGLAWGAGAATVKLALLLRCGSDLAFIPTYLKVSKMITRQIILGMVLLTLSGIGWLLLGHAFTPRLIVKLVLVAAIWVLGPVIDNVAEPRFQESAPAPGEAPSPSFVRNRDRYLALEWIATLLFYVIIVLWVLV